jgi:hypothetical protein
MARRWSAHPGEAERCLQFAVCGFKHNQFACSGDFDAEIAALGCLRRDEEQCLASAIGGVAGINHLLSAGNKTQRYAHSLNRLRLIRMGIDHNHGEFPLRRALLRS